MSEPCPRCKELEGKLQVAATYYAAAVSLLGRIASKEHDYLVLRSMQDLVRLLPGRWEIVKSTSSSGYTLNPITAPSSEEPI